MAKMNRRGDRANPIKDIAAAAAPPLTRPTCQTSDRDTFASILAIEPRSGFAADARPLMLAGADRTGP